MRFASVPVLALGAAVLGACGDDATGTVAPAVSSASAGVGGGTSAGGGGGGTEPLAVSATDGSLPLTFNVAVDGSAGDPFGAASIVDGFGSVTVQGETMPAVVYERHDFVGYQLFQTMAVSPERVVLLWFYCQEGELTWIYAEGTHGLPLVDAQASGSCVETMAATNVDVSLPAVSMPPPAPLTGYSVDGADLEVPDGAPGRLVVDGRELTVFAFEDVDCSTGCGDPGWYEIHAMLWDPEFERLCFAILYLYPGLDEVAVTYSLTLPDLSDPVGTTYLPATWSTP